MKTVSIVGFGRFGKTLYKLLKDDFQIIVYDKNEIDSRKFTKKTTIAKSVNEIYNSEVIFFAVPISSFEDVISTHKKYFQSHHILIDVLSVKMYPATIFKKNLTGSNTQALLTHPMFGPDSSKEGFEGLPIVLDKFRTDEETYSFWKEYFMEKGLRIVEMSAREHDKAAANSQGLTHFIGRLLEAYDFKVTPIDTLGARKLLEVMGQTCNDTWELFEGLQHYNPYTKEMRSKLGIVYDKLYNKLLPKQKNPNSITYGIQGGKGSFNEEALLYYTKQTEITNYRLKYLYTADRVLRKLHEGEIDIGQVAIQNSVGGVVEESLQAIAKFPCSIVKEFAIKISHALMIRNDANFDEVTTIMSHPQVFAQCKDTLLTKYPHLKQISGEGELIDQTKVAKYLSQNRLPKHMATMGSKVLAKLYDLKIIEDNLQDAKTNYTSFLHVARV